MKIDFLLAVSLSSAEKNETKYIIDIIHKIPILNCNNASVPKIFILSIEVKYCSTTFI